MWASLCVFATLMLLFSFKTKTNKKITCTFATMSNFVCLFSASIYLDSEHLDGFHRLGAEIILSSQTVLFVVHKSLHFFFFFTISNKSLWKLVQKVAVRVLTCKRKKIVNTLFLRDTNLTSLSPHSAETPVALFFEKSDWQQILQLYFQTKAPSTANQST